MSLILDALKRSEGERQEKAGSITVNSYPTPERRRPAWMPMALGAILLINLLAISWLLFGNRAASHHPATTEPSAAASSQLTTHPAPPASIPVPAVIPAVAAPPRGLGMRRPVASSRRQVAPTSATPKAPQQDSKDVVPLPKRPLAAELARPVRTPARKVAAPPPSAASTPEPAAGPVTAPATQPPIHPDNATPTAPHQTSVSAPATVTHTSPPAPGNDIPTMDEVEPSVRTKLSAYEINAHVYSNEPVKRFVLINMQRFQEGDTLPGSSYRLIEIRPTGIVIDYGQGKVLMPLSKF